MSRVEKGFCLVVNPYNRRQVSRVSLRAEDVDAFVFWSKNPRPMLSYLDRLMRSGYFFYFQFTLNDYPRQIEPYVPSLAERVETFKNLAHEIGAERVIWRYDPIVITRITDCRYHLERFRNMAKRLSGYTRRVMISLVDLYRKTDRRLSQLEKDGIWIDRHHRDRPETMALLTQCKSIAEGCGLEIFSCAEQMDLSPIGINPGACIDTVLMRKWGLSVGMKKDPGQRAACNCAVSRDIGMTDSCLHGCRYCYATRDHQLAQKKHAQHDVESLML